MIKENKPLLSLTDAAANRVKSLMEETNSDVIGLRIGIKTAGCSGMKYNVEYATDVKPFEEKIISKNVVICIDPAAIMFLIGSEMDYKEEKFSSGFDFSNPNEIARCGCGESFTVA
ncbi:iron-sulfur cluster assembly accessory protein [Alphaproteobacteria bacterium]|nr:iron-sulfur cluster assembly accessory protein [Alphaproteobacteria bacterium]MDB9870651.1 iron-sulfur cluster assembly accessory protein [Alphaproteobacteria bacterium]MDC1209813.1 iron-sulfur cluster assembly accessory protein [Pseudomonadota bacterium]